MSQYIDGFVLPIASDKVEAYREMATTAGELWTDHGALEYAEFVGDDLTPDVEDMEVTTFPELVDAGADETVVFSVITYESRVHRDEVNAAVMDELDDGTGREMPFDVSRMAYGGFDGIVELARETTQSVEPNE